ncbi:MAG: FAD-binding oxidoreductase, partial [Bdellovibrio sp.]
MKGLSEIFEKNDWSQDPEVLALYGADWTKHYHVKARAVVFPRSEDQVMELVKWARKEKQALVPSGGRTGLSAAAFATSGEVVVSFEKMNKIKEWNAYDQQVICEPGVITENLQNFVLEKGFFFPVDFASRGSSQIGGNVATNAGGIKVIRYGLMRNWVAGLRVVTGRGEILSLNNGLIKNATGYDLRHLFIGSEGTLGFFTEITLSVTLPPSPTQVFVLGIPRLESIMEVYLAFKRKMPLMAVELFTELSTQYVVAQGHVKRPFETQTPYYLLLEIEESFMDEAMTVFESCLEKGNVEDGVISQNKQQAKELWRLREDITEATAHKDPY